MKEKNQKIETREKTKKKGKVHEGIIKEVLDIKTELADFIRDFMGFEITANDIELCNREYRTSLGLNTKYMDLFYQIKGEETYILLEHQSTVDYSMPERMPDYCTTAIMSIEGNTRRNKSKIVPLIYPCVLNTSNKKWDAPRRMVNNGPNRFRFPDQVYPEYYVVDINDYLIDKLISMRTGIALAMAFEKVKIAKEGIYYITNKLKEFEEVNEREKMVMNLVIENIQELMQKAMKNSTKEEKEKIKKEMIEIMNKGGNYMSNFEKVVTKALKEADEARGEGISIGIMQVVKEMIKNKMKDEDIIKYTHISEKELEELKLQMA